MIRAAAFCLIALPAWAQEIPVPSGQSITYVETVQNQPGTEGLTYRFRFVAPAIDRDGTAMPIEEAAADMDYLCASFALSRLPGVGPVPSQIIISLMDRAFDFRTSAPEATQFFEAYRIEDGTCIWEGF